VNDQRQRLKLRRFLEWAHNPLMWMAEANDDPEVCATIHEIAFEKGMIQYIPDHRE